MAKDAVLNKDHCLEMSELHNVATYETGVCEAEKSATWACPRSTFGKALARFGMAIGWGLSRTL